MVDEYDQRQEAQDLSVGQSMHPSKVINAILQQYLAPLMKSQGFYRKGQRFWRKNADRIEVLDLQKSQWNSSGQAEFTINMGVFWPAIDAFSEDPVRRLPPRTSDCTINERIGRLFGDGLDFWWEVHGPGDIVRLGQDLCNKVSSCALPWLASMRSVRALVAYDRKHPCLFAKIAVDRYLKAKKRGKTTPNRHPGRQGAGRHPQEGGARWVEVVLR